MTETTGKSADLKADLIAALGALTRDVNDLVRDARHQAYTLGKADALAEMRDENSALREDVQMWQDNADAHAKQAASLGHKLAQMEAEHADALAEAKREARDEAYELGHHDGRAEVHTARGDAYREGQRDGRAEAQQLSRGMVEEMAGARDLAIRRAETLQKHLDRFAIPINAADDQADRMRDVCDQVSAGLSEPFGSSMAAANIVHLAQRAVADPEGVDRDPAKFLGELNVWTTMLAHHHGVFLKDLPAAMTAYVDAAEEHAGSMAQQLRDRAGTEAAQ